MDMFRDLTLSNGSHQRKFVLNICRVIQGAESNISALFDISPSALKIQTV